MSTPLFNDIDLADIPWQLKAHDTIRDADYSRLNEFMCSGSVGSAKSVFMAYMGLDWAFDYPGAVIGLGRLAMPQLRETLLQVLIQMTPDWCIHDFNKTTGILELTNGSRFIPFSWADGKFKKFRSYEFSNFMVEELTENEERDFYNEILMRVGRIRGVPPWIMCATNPDDPSHWAYKHWDMDKSDELKDPFKKVFMSVTTDNPYLPDGYLEQLQAGLTDKLAQRMIYGKWVEIAGETLYYAYSKEHNYVLDRYIINERSPVYVGHDFNIGEGKPMSACLAQYIGGVFHFFNEAVVSGADTRKIMDEMLGRGLFDEKVQYIITGDCSGRSRSSKSVASDYDIIAEMLSNYRTSDGRRINFEMDVPLSNPPVRTRHNEVNTRCFSSDGKRRLKVYKDAPTVDEGMRLTKLKLGGKYIEDDGPRHPYQHVTTALGYLICTAMNREQMEEAGMISR